ncbi:hypothetical protein MSAN_00432100 [Mycena sanguinolenta]|uniref:Uncharacterized protein n=1 Tax=Mycena sanguinolenta TaxID=230812 RepID=A0A8H6ZDL5_9AGAR|nr:hypothetical protein MSAN_00432100 [Mycena sanguinolenta]
MSSHSGLIAGAVPSDSYRLSSWCIDKESMHGGGSRGSSSRSVMFVARYAAPNPILAISGGRFTKRLFELICKIFLAFVELGSHVHSC